MPYSDYTEELTGLKDVVVSFVERKDSILHIHLMMEQRIHTCPRCGERTSKVHDYREQRIKDISSFGQFTVLHLKKRRHACPACGKRFYENVDFLPRYHRITNRLYTYILNEFTETRSMKSIARSNNVSQTTAARAVDYVSYTPSELPEVLSIDEFRGNSGGVKFQCILTDPVNRKVFDILPTRSQEYLYWYFSKFKERRNVKFVVMDMYKSYKLMAKVLFPNATVIVDRYHFTRMVTWAFERVRIEEQKKFSDHRRKAFKNSRSILLKHSDSLTLDEIRQVEVMLSASEKLRHAYIIKENFEIFMKCKDSQSARKQLGYWNMYAMNYDLPEFENVAKTFSRWSKEILNSFDYPYTNGYTEGCNNKIKVLKRVAYGMPNFDRFRSRIMHAMAH
jgi:Transposase and inactivated derivatives